MDRIALAIKGLSFGLFPLKTCKLVRSGVGKTCKLVRSEVGKTCKIVRFGVPDGSELALFDEGGDALDDGVFVVVFGVVGGLEVYAEEAAEGLPKACAEAA